MSEPTNPLFEEEKEFLERKKLEYERALRGDVAHIKDQTANVGKLALIGAGAATGLWLLVKAFRGRKHHDDRHDDHDGYSARDGRDDRGRRDERDYASGRNGRYDQGYGMAYDDQPDGAFFDFDDDDDERWIKHEPTRFEEDEANENFDPEEMMARGMRAYEQEKARDPRRNNFVAGSPRGGDDDDNGLSQYPNFPAHSAHQPGDGQNQPDHQPSGGFYFTDDDHFGYSEPGGRSAEAADRGYTTDEPAFDFADRDAKDAPEPAVNRPFYHPDHSHPTANQAPGDRRHLPDSDGFQSLTSTQKVAATSPQTNSLAEPQAKPGETLGSMLFNFATSETGRALLGQAAAVGMALFGKAVKDRMPREPLTVPTLTETAGSADLAASTSPAARAGQSSSAPDASSADLAAASYFPDDTAR